MCAVAVAVGSSPAQLPGITSGAGERRSTEITTSVVPS
jgi:hypothetical protein